LSRPFWVPSPTKKHCISAQNTPKNGIFTYSKYRNKAFVLMRWPVKSLIWSANRRFVPLQPSWQRLFAEDMRLENCSHRWWLECFEAFYIYINVQSRFYYTATAPNSLKLCQMSLKHPNNSSTRFLECNTFYFSLVKTILGAFSHEKALYQCTKYSQKQDFHILKISKQRLCFDALAC